MSNWLETKQLPEEQMTRYGDFYPEIGLRKFYRQYRPPSELPAETVLEHLKTAMIYVCRELLFWQREQTAPTLAGVNAEKVSGESELVILFERAVYCEAKANILKETLTADRRSAAENNAKTSDETEDKYREFAADAISMIVGQDRVFIADI